jgi:TDG/mug DNA glycosylase family protein
MTRAVRRVVGGRATKLPTLPDYLRSGLDLVFVGINPGLYSALKGHYFARSTNRFWPAFTRSKLSARVREGLSVEILGPEHDVQLLGLGIGFTDVVKRASRNAAELDRADFVRWAPRLLDKLRRSGPRVACFHGLTAYRPFLALALGETERAPTLGVQPEVIGATRLFVVPNPSPANAHFTLADQAGWYDRLADFLLTCTGSVGDGGPGATSRVRGSSAARFARRSP